VYFWQTRQIFLTGTVKEIPEINKETHWTSGGRILNFNKEKLGEAPWKEVPAMSRILVADSEPHIQQLCREELQDEGYEVRVTGKGREVVLLVDSFKPDMVILEMLLPDISGREIGLMVKGTKKDTRVIFYTNCIPPRDLSAWGGDDFVIKSSDLDGLKEVVRRLLPARGTS
jgi:CheY-like chemotaxis protein